VTGGLDGEEVCGAPGLLVSHRAAEGRMQSEVSPFGAPGTPAILAALHAAAPPAAADASPVWLWAPQPFRIGEATAQPALRLLRAARWLLPLDHAGLALRTAGEAYARLGPGTGLRLHIGAEVEVEVGISPREASDPGTGPRSEAFTLLLTRLGQPTWAEYSTHSIEAGPHP